jgi:Zn-finger protein
MTKNGHREKQRRELMVGVNQCVYYPCPLTSEPGT